MILKLAISSVCVALLAVSAIAGGKRNSAAEPQDARDIRAVLDRQVEAWNRHDLEGFMRGYWQSDQLSFYSGATKTTGWQATIDRYRKRYQSEGREMGHLDFYDQQLDMLGPRAAFVRGRWRLKTGPTETGGLFTLILRKFGDGWKIVHDHTGAE
jgi:beta-aspartyl-peptidase (threonine type)